MNRKSDICRRNSEIFDLVKGKNKINNDEMIQMNRQIKTPVKK